MDNDKNQKKEKSQETPTHDVVVIGGGASGMMAAGHAAELGKKVLLLEKNKSLGEKLKITGGGRCNITNAEYDKHEFLSHYGKAGKFLHSPLSQFGVEDTFAFFESRGLPLVVQARKRAFPHTEDAKDVAKVMEKYVKDPNVEIKTGVKVLKILTDEDRIVGVKTKDGVFSGKSYVVASGGGAHAETGASSGGFKWLTDLGHTVKESSPDIVPLAVRDEWVHALSGRSLSFMKISFFLDGVRKISKKGKILFTHFGLSGPLILNTSREVKDLLDAGPVTATIDTFPDTDLGALEKHILKEFNHNKNKQFKNVFKDIAPKGTSEAIMSLLEIDPDKQVNSITVEERKEIAHLLKALPMTIDGLMGYDRAVIADGGVVLEEVDTRTLRSKLYENLYLTGDILHINRPSGGYSLQLCWTTGYVAGENA